MTRVRMLFDVEDNEEKNVVLPKSWMTETVFANDSKTCFSFTKIDPSKQNWGNIRLLDCVAEFAQYSTVNSH